MTEQEFREHILKELAEINNKVNPMYEAFTSVNGFNKVAVGLMKFFAALGSTIVALYVLIEFFKKLSK